MKKCPIIFLIFVSVKLFPQQINQLPMGQTLPLQHDSLVSKYQAKKKGSNILLVFSSVLFVGGSALCTGSVYGLNNSNEPFSYVAPMVIGAGIGVIGLAIFVPSVFKHVNAVKKLNKLNANLSIAIAPTAFRIAYKF